MSEITKLYKNAGIRKQEIENCTYKNSTPCGHICDDGEDCPYLEIKNDYPPFTTEKQLEITKFLLKKAVYYDVKDDKYWFYYEECESAGYKPFDEAIAHFINKLWQDLTEEEKQQVKGILE